MGIICSQSIQKLGKHTVVPDNEIKPNQLVMNDVKKFGHDTIDNIRVVKPARDSQQIVTIPTTKPEPLPRKLPLPKVNGSPAASTPSKNTEISSTSSTKSQPSTSTTNRADSCSDIFTDRFQSPHQMTSSIHTNSILFRSNTPYDARTNSQSAIFNNQSNINTGPAKQSQRNSVTLTPFDACRTNEPTKDSPIPRSLNRNPFSTNLSKVRRRFGGSFQTLLNPSNNGTSTVRSFSASENNLSVLSVGKRKALAQKRFSTNSDYCPSVLFNRIANKRNEEKNLTLTRWKNYFMVNILRRKKDISSRKT